jgi:hypothetical protein
MRHFLCPARGADGVGGAELVSDAKKNAVRFGLKRSELLVLAEFGHRI